MARYNPVTLKLELIELPVLGEIFTNGFVAYDRRMIFDIFSFVNRVDDFETRMKLPSTANIIPLTLTYDPYSVNVDFVTRKQSFKYKTVAEEYDFGEDLAELTLGDKAKLVEDIEISTFRTHVVRLKDVYADVKNDRIQLIAFAQHDDFHYFMFDTKFLIPV